MKKKNNSREVVMMGRIAIPSGNVAIVDIKDLIDHNIDFPAVQKFINNNSCIHYQKRTQSGNESLMTFKTGLGDGIYPVFAEIKDCGIHGKRISKVIIQML